MVVEALMSDIEVAFAARLRPAAEDITHCTYEKRFGGSCDGPCVECSEMNDCLGGRDWRSISAHDLNRYGQADAQMTIQGYCYLLPAYPSAAIQERSVVDVCVDHLAFRFGPNGKGRLRLAQILAELSERERQVVLAYFRFTLAAEKDWDGSVVRSITNLEASLAAP